MKYTSEQISQINNSMSLVRYAQQYLHLDYHNREYWAICPFHKDLNASLSFNEEKNAFNCFGCGSKGHLINFIMQYHKYSFLKAVEYILQLTKISLEEKEYSDVMEFLHKSNIQKSNKLNQSRIILANDIMNQYIKKPIKEWISEGIDYNVLEKYQVRYDEKRNSIVFPIRDSEGNFISIKARTLLKNYADLGISKYIYYNSIGTNDFLFGLYENYKSIKEKNEIIILEGAKGVMLAESYGYDNCVSLETNRINDLQLNILLQLKVDVVMCLDKGIKITKGKPRKADNIQTTVNIGLLPSMTNVYIMEDKEGLLKDKDCPADKGKEIFDKLYDGRYKI